MYIFTSSIVLILCFILATVTSLPIQFSSFEDVPFQNIVIFGDSLSDNGNVYALTNETYPIPPYWKGRFSNGPNWIDQLNMTGISDYAYGSATTDSNLVQGYTKGNTIPVPGMLQQVQIYLNNTNVNTIDFERTLYILFGGGNDFIFDNDLEPSVIAASLLKSAQALLDIGATNIIVFNQVPVQYFPFSKPFEAFEFFTFLTDQGNFYITNFTESIQLDNPQASLKIFDIHSLVLNIVTQNSTYFTNTVDNCWINFNVTTVLELCPNPEEYLFVDTIHFTSSGHKLIADAIRPFLIQSTQTTSTQTTSTQTTSTQSTSTQTTSTQSTSTQTTSTQTTSTQATSTQTTSTQTTSTQTTSTQTTSTQTTSTQTTLIQTTSTQTTSTQTTSTQTTSTQTTSTQTTSTQTTSTQTNSAVTFIPLLNSKDTLIFFSLLQFLRFSQ
jgi:phospholipase/lecithinase/hemolysin